jgi:hypothetical protein
MFLDHSPSRLPIPDSVYTTFFAPRFCIPVADGPLDMYIAVPLSFKSFICTCFLALPFPVTPNFLPVLVHCY